MVLEIATPYGLAMTEVVVIWSRFAVVRWLSRIVPRNGHNRSLHFFSNGSSQYAERKLATGREVLLDYHQVKPIRPAFAPGQARYAEREPATSREVPMV